jgi:DNA-binding GntR family transcriptional regulator
LPVPLACKLTVQGVKLFLVTEDRPLYLRIVEEIRAKIDSGELPPGARLPSRPELMRDYGVSNSVALQVGRVLVSEGLAEARSGSGTYVRQRREPQRLVRSFTLRLGTTEGSPFQADMERQGHRAAWSYKSRTAIAPPEIRERLALGEAGDSEDVVRTEYVFTSNGEPSELSTSWEPLDLTIGTPVVMPEDGPAVGVMDRMRVIGVMIDGATEAVRARIAASEESAALKLPPGAIVFTIARTYFAQERPVETADIVISAERYELLYGERVPPR